MSLPLSVKDPPPVSLSGTPAAQELPSRSFSTPIPPTIGNVRSLVLIGPLLLTRLEASRSGAPAVTFLPRVSLLGVQAHHGVLLSAGIAVNQVKAREKLFQNICESRRNRRGCQDYNVERKKPTYLLKWMELQEP